MRRLIWCAVFWIVLVGCEGARFVGSSETGHNPLWKNFDPEQILNAMAVKVSGDPAASRLLNSPAARDEARAIGRWRKVAVLEARAPFRIGFVGGGRSQYYETVIKTDQVRMRVGKDDVEFVAFETGRLKPVPLRLIAVTTTDDTAYAQVPLY